MQQVAQSLPLPNSLWSLTQQKSFKFHQHLRQKHIQSYKAQKRRQFESQQNLAQLLATIPQELQEVLKWCEHVVEQLNGSRQYRFEGFKIVELYKIMEKFPCLQTVQLMYSVCHRITIEAIHQLFQYDIVGLLQKLIFNPEKIVPRILINRSDQRGRQKMYIEITKKSMLVLASLSEQSQRARNFIVMNHKSFLCINRVYQKLSHQIERQYILCMYAFTCHNLRYDEQFVRIIKTICVIFCSKSNDLENYQLSLIIKILTSVVKSKQKWAMDLIQQVTQYDIQQKILQILQQSNKLLHSKSQSSNQQSQHSNSTIRSTNNGNSIDRQLAKKTGQIIHLLNIFLINYIEVTTNHYFAWESFMAQWFGILGVGDSALQNARRDVYFIFNNIICEAQQPESSYQLLQSMIFQHNCIHIFSQSLQTQTNQDLLQQLSYCIHSLLQHKNISALSQDIIQSQLLQSCLQAVTRNFYPTNYDTKQALMMGIEKLLERTEDGAVREAYLGVLWGFGDRLEELSLGGAVGDEGVELGAVIDRVLAECVREGQGFQFQ